MNVSWMLGGPGSEDVSGGRALLSNVMSGGTSVRDRPEQC